MNVLALKRVVVPAVLGLLGTAWAMPGASAAMDDWQPAEVVDSGAKLETPSALFSTSLGRAVTVYGIGSQTWASSRPPGDDRSWGAPQQLLHAPPNASAGPVVAGAGGGAVAFLQSDFGEVAYASMTPQGTWGVARPFPYEGTFEPDAALVGPGSGIVAVGTTGRGRVRAAVKPPGERWQLSPGLELGYADVRGAWYDAADRVHVLVAQRGHADRTHSRNIVEVVLHAGAKGLTWGPLRTVPRNTGGSLASVSDVSVLTNSAGAVTVLWRDNVDGTVRQFVRHRQPGQGWTPTRSLPLPALDLPVRGTLAEDGVTRLVYVTTTGAGVGAGQYELVTRLLSAEGTLGEEIVLDSFTGDGIALTSAEGAPGELLLRWDTGTDGEVRLFRCAPEGCTAVGTSDTGREALLALTPAGVGFLAGVGDDVPGCPGGSLCSRRLEQL